MQIYIYIVYLNILYIYYIYKYILYIYIYIYIQRMVGLSNKTTQVYYSEFHAFCNHQVHIYFIYVFLKSVIKCKYGLFIYLSMNY